MELTLHAEARCRQRGILPSVISIIEECGRTRHAPGGIEAFFFGHREAARLRSQLKKIIQMLDKAANTTLVISKDKVITVYKH